MTLLALLLLAQPLQGVGLSQNDGGEKYVRHLNCTGSGITCSSSSTFGTINVTGGGSGITVPSCSGGQATTANGSSFSCVSNVSTATALAANPTDCSTNQYATTIAANGNLTCSQVSYSQLSGSPLAGGSNPQVQYNNSGVLGGLANVIGDGTRMTIVGETSHPSSPAQGATHYDFTPAQLTFPQLPFTNDVSMGTPIPQGLLGVFTEGMGSNWSYYCANVGGTGIFGTRGAAPSAGNWGSTGGQQQTADGGVCGQSLSGSTCNNLFWRMNWILSSGTGTANQQSTLIQPFKAAWRGNTAGAGGFIWWTRVAFHLSRKQVRYFFGLQGPTTGFAAADPNSVTDTVYFGSNSGDTSLSICSNDETGTATCSSLGSSYPTQSPDFGTDGGLLLDTIYDMWLAAPPNGSFVSYYISVVNGTGSGAHTGGTISSDLPISSVFMTALNEMNAADAGAVGAAPSIYFNGMCVAYSY